MESVLLIPVIEAESIASEWRQRYDPAAAAGVPAHITVLYPFLDPERIGSEALAAIAQIAARHESFDFELRDLRRFPQGVLYLAPSREDRFIRLAVDVSERFPETRPYGGRYPEIVPHLTLSMVDDGLFERLRGAVSDKLPVKAQAREVWLMEGTNESAWRFRYAFPLGGGRRA